MITFAEVTEDQQSIRGVAQLGSVPLWGSGGRGFKSRRSDFKTKIMISIN